LNHKTWLVAIATGLLTRGAVAQDSPNKDQPKTDRTDHVRVGAIGGVGFPHPFAVEALVKIERVVAVGAEYGFSPDIGVSGVNASLWSAAGDLRVFPLRGPLFIGARVGLQHFGASMAQYAQSMSVDTWFVNPRVGFLWTWKSGFSLGFDAGVQLPLTYSVSGTAAATSQPQLVSIANTIGGSVLPTIDLLRLGFLL
jgi:hypothetical protein